MGFITHSLDFIRFPETVSHAVKNNPVKKRKLLAAVVASIIP